MHDKLLGLRRGRHIAGAALPNHPATTNRHSLARPGLSTRRSVPDPHLVFLVPLAALWSQDGVPELVLYEMLEDVDPDNVENATNAQTLLVRRAVPQLVKLLYERDCDVKRTSALVLGGLADTYDDEEEDEQLRELWTTFATEVLHAIFALVPMLKKKSTRAAAVYALSSLSAHNSLREAISKAVNDTDDAKALVGCLSCDDMLPGNSTCCQRAANLLLRLASDVNDVLPLVNAGAVPALLKLLDVGPDRARKSSVAALTALSEHPKLRLGLTDALRHLDGLRFAENLSSEKNPGTQWTERTRSDALPPLGPAIGTTHACSLLAESVSLRDAIDSRVIDIGEPDGPFKKLVNWRTSAKRGGEKTTPVVTLSWDVDSAAAVGFFNHEHNFGTSMGSAKILQTLTKSVKYIGVICAGKIVALVSYRMHTTEASVVGYVSLLAVGAQNASQFKFGKGAPDIPWRGCGLGAILLQQVEKQVQLEAGARACSVELHAIEGLRAYYESMGLEQVESLDIYVEAMKGCVPMRRTLVASSAGSSATSEQAENGEVR